MNKTPKKILAIVVAAVSLVSIVSIGAISSFAAGSGYESKKNFSDTNQDGICDYAGEYCHYLDADNNGICDNQSHAHNAGQRNRARCRGNR